MPLRLPSSPYFLFFFLSHGVAETGAVLVSWLHHYVVNMHMFVIGYTQSVRNVVRSLSRLYLLLLYAM